MEKSVRSVANFFQRGNQKSSPRVLQTLWGKVILLIWYTFDISLNIEHKRILTSAENLTTGVSKLHSSCPEKHLDGDSSFEVLSFFEIFRTLSKIRSDFSGKIAAEWSKLVCVQETLEEKPLWQKIQFFFKFFRPLSTRKMDFCLDFLAWAPEPIFPCPVEEFDQNYKFLKKTKILSINSNLESEVFWCWL